MMNRATLMLDTVVFMLRNRGAIKRLIVPGLRVCGRMIVLQGSLASVSIPTAADPRPFINLLSPGPGLLLLSTDDARSFRCFMTDLHYHSLLVIHTTRVTLLDASANNSRRRDYVFRSSNRPSVIRPFA